MRRLTFKEREQKLYMFPNEDVPNILEQLLQLKLSMTWSLALLAMEIQTLSYLRKEEKK